MPNVNFRIYCKINRTRESGPFVDDTIPCHPLIIFVITRQEFGT